MLTDKQLFLFDIDGTLCLGNTWIDGAKELLTLLEKQGKQYLFLTNNSTKSQEDYMEKFQEHGISCEKGCDPDRIHGNRDLCAKFVSGFKNVCAWYTIISERNEKIRSKTDQ